MALDISSNALAKAKKCLGEKAQEIEWFEADITEFVASRQFALWHDRAVYHFLTEASDRKRYREVLQRSLKPGGYLILAAFAIGGPTRCSGLDVLQYNSAKLLGELGEEFELIEEAEEIHITPTGTEQRFSSFRLLRK